MILVIGDDKAASESTELVQEIETAVVKWELSQFAAHHLPLEKARQMIREAAQTAVSRIGEIPLAELPDSLHLEIDFSLSEIAHLCSLIPGVERIDVRTIGYKGTDYREIQHVRIVCTNLSLACVSSHF